MIGLTLSCNVWIFRVFPLKIRLLCKDFDLLRNARPAVPMYADGRALLAFQTFLQFSSLSKRLFDKLKRDFLPKVPLVFYYLAAARFFRPRSASSLT